MQKTRIRTDDHEIRHECGRDNDAGDDDEGRKEGQSNTYTLRYRQNAAIARASRLTLFCRLRWWVSLCQGEQLTLRGQSTVDGGDRSICR
jgi:hypothetical protein